MAGHEMVGKVTSTGVGLCTLLAPDAQLEPTHWRLQMFKQTSMKANVQPVLRDRSGLGSSFRVEAGAMASGYVSAQPLHRGMYRAAVGTGRLRLQAVSGYIEGNACQIMLFLKMLCQLSSICEGCQADVATVRWCHFHGFRLHQSSAVQDNDSNLSPDWALVLSETSPTMWARAFRTVNVGEHHCLAGYIGPVRSMFSAIVKVHVLCT